MLVGSGLGGSDTRVTAAAANYPSNDLAQRRDPLWLSGGSIRGAPLIKIV